MYTRELDAMLGAIMEKSQRLIVVCDKAGSQRGMELAGEICTLAADYRQAQKMAQEATAPDRYSLATLPAPIVIDAEDDTESPCFEG